MLYCSVSWSLQQWQNSSHTCAKWHRPPLHPRPRHHQQSLNNPLLVWDRHCGLWDARWDVSLTSEIWSDQVKEIGRRKKKKNPASPCRRAAVHIIVHQLCGVLLLRTFKLILTATTTTNYSWRFGVNAALQRSVAEGHTSGGISAEKSVSCWLVFTIPKC